MKKTILAAAIAACAAAPALAQSVDPAVSDETVRPQANLQRAPAYAPGQPYAYAPDQAYAQFGQSYGMAPGAVYENGEKVGQDPDADIRLQLRRDAQTSDPHHVPLPADGLGATMIR